MGDSMRWRSRHNDKMKSVDSVNMTMDTAAGRKWITLHVIISDSAVIVVAIVQNMIGTVLFA